MGCFGYVKTPDKNVLRILSEAITVENSSMVIPYLHYLPVKLACYVMKYALLHEPKIAHTRAFILWVLSIRHSIISGRINPEFL